MEDRQWTILDIVKWTTDYFKQKGIDSPRLSIELMLCQVLNLKRIDLYTQFDKPLSETERVILREMILKRVERVPLQYILGVAEFLNYTFFVNDSVMVPRPETELLVKRIFDDYLDKYSKIDILDIGTGSGCIALSLSKEFPNANILAIDKSVFALMTAKNNASNLAVRNVQFNECNILEEFPTKQKFDIVVSNPPYVPIDEFNTLEPEVNIHEPKDAITDNQNGLVFYKRFAKILPELLKPEGRFYFEFGAGQESDLTDLYCSHGFKVDFFDDFSKIPRIIRGKR